jgi:hypothetical protein
MLTRLNYRASLRRRGETIEFADTPIKDLDWMAELMLVPIEVDGDAIAIIRNAVNS